MLISRATKKKGRKSEEKNGRRGRLVKRESCFCGVVEKKKGGRRSKRMAGSALGGGYFAGARKLQKSTEDQTGPLISC